MKNPEHEETLEILMYWNLICLSDMLREYNVDNKLSTQELYHLVPYGIVRKSVIIGNATPVCDWVKEYLGIVDEVDSND